MAHISSLCNNLPTEEYVSWQFKLFLPISAISAHDDSTINIVIGISIISISISA